jgi:hypothetical protein
MLKSPNPGADKVCSTQRGCDMTDGTALNQMKLRYAGVCARCGTSLPVRSVAGYDRVRKEVVCLTCLGGSDPDVALTVERPLAENLPRAVEVDPGVAGASARREEERRRARREDRIRARHPRAAGLILAITDEPTSTTVWGVGATGEELLGAGFDRLAARGVRMLHDRRIPGTKANIDHIAVTSSGIYVIDAKRYRGRRPRLEVQGGLLRPRTEKLLVGTRDCTKLVSGMHKQVEVVSRAVHYLAAGRSVPPVVGVLCFVDAEWPLIGGAFTVDGVHVEWPKKTYGRLTQVGSSGPGEVDVWHRDLADAFPPA